MQVTGYETFQSCFVVVRGPENGRHVVVRGPENAKDEEGAETESESNEQLSSPSAPPSSSVSTTDGDAPVFAFENGQTTFSASGICLDLQEGGRPRTIVLTHLNPFRHFLRSVGVSAGDAVSGWPAAGVPVAEEPPAKNPGRDIDVVRADEPDALEALFRTPPSLSGDVLDADAVVQPVLPTFLLPGTHAWVEVGPGKEEAASAPLTPPPRRGFQRCRLTHLIYARKAADLLYSQSSIRICLSECCPHHPRSEFVFCVLEFADEELSSPCADVVHETAPPVSTPQHQPGAKNRVLSSTRRPSKYSTRLSRIVQHVFDGIGSTISFTKEVPPHNPPPLSPLIPGAPCMVLASPFGHAKRSLFSHTALISHVANCVKNQLILLDSPVFDGGEGGVVVQKNMAIALLLPTLIQTSSSIEQSTTSSTGVCSSAEGKTNFLRRVALSLALPLSLLVEAWARSVEEIDPSKFRRSKTGVSRSATSAPTITMPNMIPGWKHDPSPRRAPLSRPRQRSSSWRRIESRARPSILRPPSAALSSEGPLEQLRRSVVYLRNPASNTYASGIVVSKQGHILTCNHVLRGSSTIHVRLRPGRFVETAEVLWPPKGDRLRSEFLQGPGTRGEGGRKTPLLDIAIVQVRGHNNLWRPAPWALSRATIQKHRGFLDDKKAYEIEEGNPCVACGHPVFEQLFSGPTLTFGSVMKVVRQEGVTDDLHDGSPDAQDETQRRRGIPVLLHSSAPVHYGNSGGALLLSAGFGRETFVWVRFLHLHLGSLVLVVCGFLAFWVGAEGRRTRPRSRGWEQERGGGHLHVVESGRREEEDRTT